MASKMTIADIARIAGVAKSTVSRYLNEGYVKEETRQKIAKVIKEYNYEPNTFARLKAKESKMIGVIAPCLDSTTTSKVLMAIDETLRKEHYMSLFINTNHNTNEELRNMESLSRMNVDGILLNATQVSSSHSLMASSLDIPLVFIAQECEEGVSIINKDYEAGKAMGEYIVGHGHLDILCLSVDQSDPAIGIMRRKGLKEGLQKASYVKFLDTDFGSNDPYTKLDEYLKQHRPEAIICSTTRQLLATYQCLRKHHLKIPDDVSVAAFGGMEYENILIPKPTLIQFDPYKTGVLSAKTLIKLIKKEEVEKTQTVSYHFIEGKSVKRRTT